MCDRGKEHRNFNPLCHCYLSIVGLPIKLSCLSINVSDKFMNCSVSQDKNMGSFQEEMDSGAKHQDSINDYLNSAR